MSFPALHVDELNNNIPSFYNAHGIPAHNVRRPNEMVESVAPMFHIQDVSSYRQCC
jgi:hypothetical protein